MNLMVHVTPVFFCPYFAKFTHRRDTKRGFHVTPHKWIVYGGRRKRPAEKWLNL